MSDDVTKNLAQNGVLNAPKSVLTTLTGRYDHRLDPRRRFTIPSDWIERMGYPSQVYAIPSLSGRPCITVYSPSEIEKIMEPFDRDSDYDAETAYSMSDIGELLISVSVDNQARVRIKESYLSHINIGEKDEDVVLIGARRCFEIWSPTNRPKLDGNEARHIAGMSDSAKKWRFW